MSVKQWFVAAVGFVVLASGCSMGAEPTTETTGQTRQAVGETITTNKTNYTVGENVTLSWTNLPGNYYDWVALAPVGSPAQQYVRYSYAFGQVNGQVTFNSPPAGEYVARAFLDNSYTVLAESAPINIAPQNVPTSVSTSKATYQPSESVSVTFSGMAGYATDWLSIATPGAAGTDFVRWTYTGGQLSGTASMPLVGLSGTFVVRAHFNNGYAIAAESAQFTVGAVGTTITTDKSSYAFGETINVSYTNMQGSFFDWVALAPAGAPADDVSWWEYTQGKFNGGITLNTLPQGTFVARAYFNDTFNIAAQSAPFTVGAPGALPVSVTTDKSAYLGTERVVVNFTGMAGAGGDWIGAYRVTDDMRSFTGWAYTGTQVNGIMNLYFLPMGTYEIRAFYNDNFVLQGKTAATFTVSTAIQTDKASYTTAENIAVTFGGNKGYPRDWVSIAPQGSAPTVWNLYQYTQGYPGGILTFSAAQLGAGTYVARSYWNDEQVIRVESTAFTVQ